MDLATRIDTDADLHEIHLLAAAAVFTISLHAVASTAEGGMATRRGNVWGMPREELSRILTPGTRAEPVSALPPPPPPPPAPQPVEPKRGYKFGDFTRKLGRSLTGDKDYKIGDITKRALLGAEALQRAKDAEAGAARASSQMARAAAGSPSDDSWGRDLAARMLPELYLRLGLPGSETARLLGLPRAPDDTEGQEPWSQLTHDAFSYVYIIDPRLKDPDVLAAPWQPAASSSAHVASGGTATASGLEESSARACGSYPASMMPAEERSCSLDRRQAEEAALLATSEPPAGWGIDEEEGGSWVPAPALRCAPGPRGDSAAASEIERCMAREAALMQASDPPQGFSGEECEGGDQQAAQAVLSAATEPIVAPVALGRSSGTACPAATLDMEPLNRSVEAVRCLLDCLTRPPPRAKRAGRGNVCYHYDARARVALQRTAALLRVPSAALLQMERQRAKSIYEDAAEMGEGCGAAEEEMGAAEEAMCETLQRRAADSATSGPSENSWSALKVGAATVAGGGLMLLTGGLAAPVLTSLGGALLGFVPVAGAATGAVVASSAGAVALTAGLTYYGASAAAAAAREMVGGVQQFGYLDLDEPAAAGPLAPVDECSKEDEAEAWENLEDLEAVLIDLKGPSVPAGGLSGEEIDHEGVQPGRPADSAAPPDVLPEAPALLPVSRLLPLPLRDPPLPANLSLIICVSGFMASPEGFTSPWKLVAEEVACPGDGVACQAERYAVVFDASVLRAVAFSVQRFACDQALRSVFSFGLEAVLSATAALPLTALNLIRRINAPWRLALQRAEDAGTMLGRQLAVGVARGRPVTLVGYSMGAVAVYHALLELSRLGCRGIVQAAVLMGAPISTNDSARWACARAVVAGRLVNAYAPKDLTLSVVFRYKMLSATSLAGMTSLAGLSPVEGAGVENRDIGDIVSCHADYESRMPDLLARLGLSVASGDGLQCPQRQVLVD